MYVFKGKVEEYSKRSNELNESADCSVKALATVLNTTYDKAHFHLKEHCGYYPESFVKEIIKDITPLKQLELF
ncbi:MAG: hypothetical protein RR959_09135 [Erysipelotrichaceae bacterium]